MAEKHKCPVCGLTEFEEEGSYDLCEKCGWWDDPVQDRDHDYKGGANSMSVNEAIAAYQNGEQVT